MRHIVVFFFQAEDGIRDFHVTGVQTCALPICRGIRSSRSCRQMELAPPRGTTDLLPPESERMRRLYDLAHDVANLYGYRYAETPAFEPTELFVRTSGATSEDRKSTRLN